MGQTIVANYKAIVCFWINFCTRQFLIIRREFFHLGLAAYLIAFAAGMAPIPWTVNSEIYPLWARSFATSGLFTI